MREIEIKGKRKLVFVITDRDAATIVIPIESLGPVDYKRFSEMEAKGGELMSVMRDTKLSNGMNALVQYSDLFRVVKKEPKPEPEPKEPKATSVEKSKSENENDGAVGEKPKRRGRGRRPKVEKEEA